VFRTVSIILYSKSTARRKVDLFACTSDGVGGIAVLGPSGKGKVVPVLNELSTTP
jgi:hypothetical protein